MKFFTVVGIDQRVSDALLLQVATCGVIFDTSTNKYVFINPRYFVNFKLARADYLKELKDGHNQILIHNFSLRAQEVNMTNFM